MTSTATAVIRAGARIAQHFGRPGTPNDQAWVESFFGHLKGEFSHLEKITDPGELEAELDRLRVHYNTVRLSLGVRKVWCDVARSLKEPRHASLLWGCGARGNQVPRAHWRPHTGTGDASAPRVLRQRPTCTTPVVHVALRCKLVTWPNANLAAQPARWPSEKRIHEGIGYVTPEDEHYGRGEAIRAARRAGLAAARRAGLAAAQRTRIATRRQTRKDHP